MVKFYLAYPPAAEKEAVDVGRAFADLGLVNTQDSCASVSEAIQSADFLFVLLTAAEQIDLPDIRNAWETFDNEIRWKRKAYGEILFLVPDEDALKNLPLRLKNYGYYLLDEADDAASYCDDKLREAEKKAADKREAMPPVKPIVYTPSPYAVKQIEFSVRAPQVESFDGAVSRQGAKSDTACRENHVFDGMGDTVPQKQKPSKSSKRGCAAGIMVLLLAVAVVVAMCIVLGGQTATGERLFSGVSAVQIPQIFDGGRVWAAWQNALQAVGRCGII